MTANVITYRGRSAARDIGKALGFAPEALERLSSLVAHWGWHDPDDTAEQQFQQAGFDLHDPRIQKFLSLYVAAQNLPRHLGQHSGGMVICQGQLDADRAAGTGDHAGTRGDRVGQRRLRRSGPGQSGSAGAGHDGGAGRIARADSRTLPAKKWIWRICRRTIRRSTQALQKADTIGLFQVESRAQMSCLPRLKPKKFYDIVVQVAIIRPGPDRRARCCILI